MADQVVFRHPSGATTNCTERGAAEFARLNPEWVRQTDEMLEELMRPGLTLLAKIFLEVEASGVGSRDLKADWDALAKAMRTLRR